jgi:putative flippase GtrA
VNVARLVRFGIVGAVAAATHFFVTIGFVSLGGWRPQLANVAGYAVALAVSYLGQALWTFGQSGVNAVDFTKFAATSLTGFAANALTYASLLRWTGLDYRLALALVLLLVAMLTFLSLNHWVFAAPPRQRAS